MDVVERPAVHLRRAQHVDHERRLSGAGADDDDHEEAAIGEGVLDLRRYALVALEVDFLSMCMAGPFL